MVRPTRETSLIILTGIFTASLIAANLLGSRLLQVGGITFSVGLLVFPFTFLTADIIAEIFGKEKALKVVRTGIILQVYVLFFVFLGLVIPGSPHRDTDLAYQTMFGLTPRMVLASIVAYSVSQVMDVKLFTALKDKTKGHIILRANLALWASQFVDTLIFSGIFLGGVLPFEVWVRSFALAYVTKIAVATFDSPLVKVGVNFFGGKDHE